MKTPAALLLAVFTSLLFPAMAAAQEDPTPPPPQATPPGNWTVVASPTPTPFPDQPDVVPPAPPQQPPAPPMPPMPPRGRYVRQQPRPTPRPGIWVEGMMGVHDYTGAGWSNFQQDRYNFDSGAIEVAVRVPLAADHQIRWDAVVTAGYYGGGEDCYSSNAAGCISLYYSNFYMDVGPRLTVRLHPTNLYVFGQAGVGFYASSNDYSGVTTSTTSSRTTLSAHILGGLGVDLNNQFELFGELKYATSDGRFPTDNSDLDMGGVLVLLGAGVHFR